MNTPLVSVCLITYNHERFVVKAIESILMQKVNFKWELIIADDFSTDGTRNILKTYKENYPDLIKLILQPSNVGPANNFIELISSPSSRYIAYLEGDDYWTDFLKLQKQVDFLESNSDYSGCYHDTEVIYSNNNASNHLFREKLPEKISVVDTIAGRSPFHTSSFVFRRDALKLPPFYSKIKSGDMALFSIVAASGYLGKIPGVMSVYRKNSGGVTNSASIIDSYHEDRIYLINQLNEFHNYKYNEKAQKTIDYHKNKIAYVKGFQKKSLIQRIKSKLKLRSRIKELFFK